MKLRNPSLKLSNILPGLRAPLAIAASAALLFLPACSTTGGGSGSGGADGSGSLSARDLDAAQEARFHEGSIPTAEGEGVFRDIHFGYDSADVNDIARQNIEYNVQILQANPDVKVQLEGHTDERGTAEYNMALGERRAQAVQDVLVSYGVDRGRLETISYGEEVPLDPSANESAHSKNRRAHFSAFRTLPQG